MSLIADALKRARKSQQKIAPGAPPLMPMQNESGGFGWHLPALIVLLLVAAGVFIGLAMLGRPGQKMAAAKEMPASQTKSVGTMSNFPAVVTETNAATAILNTPIVTSPSDLILQGIVFDSNRSWAIVNGRTIVVGDTIGDFHVKEISPNVVILQRADGSQKKLVLEKPN